MKGRGIGVLLLISFGLFLFPMAHTTRSQSKIPATPSISSTPAVASAKNASGAKKSAASVKPAQKLSPAATQWVETTLRKMTLDEKVGQVIFATYHGSFTATDAPAYAEIMRDVEKLHVGGFINVTQGSPLGIVKSQAYPTAVLTNQLQAKSKLPLLVGADFERGTAMRLDEGTSFPTAMALAAAGNPKDAYTMGKITALEARAVGIHWVYATRVGRKQQSGQSHHQHAFIWRGSREGFGIRYGVCARRARKRRLATSKHFPGHGDTAADSHIDLPVIRADRDRLEHLELVPFRAAIAAGADSIMTGHLSIPALEPDPNTPATLSSNILTGLLRKELGYQGLVVTDAMDMGGITVRYAPGEAAVRAFVAGADAVLMPPVPDAAFEALRDAVKSGRITRERLDASVRRLLQAKARLGLYKERLVDVNALNKHFGKVEWQKEAQEISDRGVTLLRDTAHRLPLDGTKPTRALLVALYADPEPYPGEDLERELRSRCGYADDAARGYAVCESGQFEIARAGYVRRGDSGVVCERERPQGKRGHSGGAGGAGGTKFTRTGSRW